MESENNKTQVVMYKCCEVVFAACMEPYCYTEKTWTRDLAKYVKKGHKVEMIERGELEMGKCKCVKQDGVTAANQLSLFENEQSN